MPHSVAARLARAMTLLSLGLLALGAPAHAQSETAEPPIAPAPLPPSPSAPAATITAEPGRGILIQAGERYSLGLMARVQMRETLQHTGDINSNEANIKTLRLVVYGNMLAPELRYTFQLAFGRDDFDTNSGYPLLDAFVDWTRWRDLNIRAGQFFVPFDRARTLRESALQFVERQQVVHELALDRDVGVMLSSTDLFGLGEKLGYQFFLGGGDGRNRFEAYRPWPLSVLRLTFKPFGSFDDDQEGDLTRANRPRLAMGVAGAYNPHTSRINSNFGTAFTAGTTTYRHLAADVVFKYRGFSLLAETLWRRASADVIEGTVNGALVREATRSGYGYFVQGGMMVTPQLELAVRCEELRALRGTDPAFVRTVQTQGTQVGSGVNLYLNGHAFKVQGEYSYLFGLVGTPQHFVRVQLDASF
jgi:phosphate-selective porin OprO and OprP